MRALATDMYITRCIETYGEYSREEWEVLAQLVRPGMTVVEAGANIGVHTVPLARACAPGRLYAFEPQPAVCALLRQNLIANGLENAEAVAAACGAHTGTARIPTPDYASPGNFGGISLSPGGDGIEVSVLAIDDLRLDRLDLLKVDVEGAEVDVIRGATATIKRARPVIYAENDRANVQGKLIGLLTSLSYRLYWHTPLLADGQNFNGATENIFAGRVRSLNMLCLPQERTTRVADLEPIDPENWRSPITPIP
jgi:FkbM family methyltransferase